MKRLFAILLCFAMLLPMGTIAQAEEVAKKPFSLVNWEDSGISEYGAYENVYYTPYFWTNKENVIKGVYKVSCPSLGGSTIPEMAAALKAKFDTYPEGARYVNFTSPIASTIKAVYDLCFQGHVVPMVSEWIDEFMAEYKRIGGKLDGIISDVEYLGIYSYYIYNGDKQFDFSAKNDPLVYKKIVEHPEYQEKIRPMLVERGFKFYSPVTDNTPEIFGISPKAPAEYANCDDIWDTVMQNYQAQIVTECCEPVWKYFPDAVVNDYTSKDVKPWISVNSSGGIRNASGNAGNEQFYSTRPSGSFFKDGIKPLYPAIKTRVDAVFTNTDYNRFLYEANHAKSIRAAADDMLTWWVAHAYYNDQAYNAYYSELIFHLGLQDPEVYLGYIMRQDCKTDGTQDSAKYKNALKIVDQCLEQLNKVAGYADRKAIITGAEWNHEYVLSGMYAGGKNIWRLTPDNNVISLEDFLVADAKDPTFTVNGETITFPGGKIIKDDKIYDVGTYGFWIETAADVTPVVTRVAEYFRVANPTYQETFESFEAGTEWNYNNALPATVWENKKVGNGTAIVIADPANADNQLLEVKGNYNFKLVKLPQNVRAGDNYAKRQAWEVTVTIPSDVSAEDELTLLNIIPEKRTAKDKGIKLAGTKVYYDNAGEFVELAGVELTAGGKYTILRQMNFTTEDAFTYDLYICDAEGKEVAKVKKIPLADQNIPVYALGMNVKNASGAAVLLDDFRIYPTKTAADFVTYNATTGMAVEAGKADAGNVAYRLSWLNTEQTEKPYTVMAAYYDGETKISEEAVKEIKLPANGDGIITGVVENKQEGKQLLVYLKDNNPPEEEDIPTTDKPADEPVDDEKTGLDTQTIIIIAAAAAAVVIAIVVVVVVTASKKKKAAQTEEIAEETPEEKTEE